MINRYHLRRGMARLWRVPLGCVLALVALPFIWWEVVNDISRSQPMHVHLKRRFTPKGRL